MGAGPAGMAASRPGKGAVVSPSAADSSSSPPVDATPRPEVPKGYGLRCAQVFSPRCDVQLRSASVESVLILAREHGASAHGYTPAWFSAERLASMAERTQRFG